MTIVQQPDSLSFCGNLKDFIITGESELSFSLYSGSTILIAETYTAYNNKIIIPCKKVIEQQFTICLPDTDVFVQTRGVLDFNAHIGDTTVSFRVIKGGIGDAAEVSTVFLKSQFLTLQPQQKQTLTWQPEFLNYYTQEQCRLKLRAYFADGTNEEKYIADMETGKLYTIDLSFLKVNGKFEKQVGYYDAWIENTAGNRLTYIQRYILTHPKDNSQIYVFENTLGGLDSVCFTGLFSEKLETNGNITTINDESSDSDIDFSVIYEQNTGYIPTFEYIRWLRGFFLSCQRYHVTDSFRKIYIEESENTFRLTELNSYTFEFRYSLQSKYGFVTRNQEMLPELLEFPAGDKLFFLAPRLSEFPIAAIADDLVLPAQFSFENQWRRISIAAIIQAAISASIDATLDNIDLTDYWKKEELVRDELYLKFLDKKISSGYADKAGNSEKWNNKQMSELLDQPVRKTDSVQFKQVTADKITTDEIISDNFVSGMIGGSGWSNYLDENGKSVAETDRAVFRDALVVPQITYNCIDVISGDKANTFAFGTIKSVDTASCTAELDLLDGQSGTLKVNDICRGVFHHFSGGNNTSDGTDTNGFLSYAGFTTVYFTPSKILLDEPGAMKFRYTLQPGTTAHPMAGMNFFAYGNFTDPDRQAMTYETRYYTRRLKCVDTWVIDPTRNISMQDGLLEGLRIGGMVMHGYGSFLENAYLTGVNIQFTPSQAEEMRGKSAYSVSLSSHERVVKLDDQGNLYSLHEELNVISGDGNVISGDENVVTTIPVLSTRIQAFRGETELLFTDAVDKDRYVVAVSATGCHASVSAGVLTVTEITDYEKCYVDLKINCEGNAVFDKRFSVVVVRDGADGNPGENAVMYRLQPSASVIRRDAAGNSDIASVSCRVMKTDGTLTTVSSLPWDYQMAYHIDGGREVRYVPEREIPVSGILKNILFRLYRNTQFVTMVDSEMIPVLTDGEGSITADLDDEMQSVACDSSGAVTSGLPLTATFLMYYGTTVLALDSLASGSVPGVTASASKSTGTITVTAIGVSAADTFRIPVTGKATHNGVQYKRTVYLTINKIRRGADGARTEIRYRYAFSKPAAPSGLNPAGWFPSPEPKELISIRHTGDFALADNMYVSPVPAADSATYKSRVTFTTSCDNQVIDLLLTVSSEAGRDFGMVCPVDAGYTADGPFLWRESGDAQTVLNLVVPTAGSHFIDIVYRKDAMGKAGGDFLKYRVIHPHTCWLSTVVIDPRTNDIPEWSAPVLFPTDTPGNEQVYLLAKSHIAADLPASDPYTDEYIGEAPAYDNTKTYVRGNIVRYNGSCKVCLSSCTGITPDMTPNWEPVGWWTDDPTGVGEAFPYEYQCSRRFTDGKWGDYGNRILFMHFGKDGEVPAVMQLVPSVTQIGRTMTGSWDPEVFSVTHRNSTGEAVAAWMAVWGSNGGNVWTRIGSVERVSSKTVSVAQYPYKYYMIRTYATSDVSFGSDYLLSVSVNVVSDGATGATGATGARGATGAMPVFRGFYKDAAEYTYTDTTRDIVIYSIDGEVFTFQVRVHGATVTTPPASSAGDANWEPANKFVFVAMDTALIDGANIAGFMYKNLRMVSRKGMLNGVETDIGDVPAEQFPGFEPHIAMDGNTGDAEFNRVLVRGSLCEPFELYQSEDEWRSGRSNNWLIRQRWWTSNYLVINAVPADEGKYVRIYNASLWSLTLLLYIYNGYNSYYWVTDDQAVVVIPPRAMLEMIAVKVSRENPDDGSVHDFCRWLITSRYSDGKTSTNQRQLTIKLPGE